jgi:hypothetical protein
MAATSDKPTGSGSHALAGFEYQTDVSIWLALDLVLASKLARELTLEPLSNEDIEADLNELEPGRLTSVASFGSYRLVVQAKRRTGNAWTISGLKSLLSHGEARPSAASRLANANVRYLLVTSAAIDGVARQLSVRSAGNWPDTQTLPASLRQALPSGAAGRVAVVGSQDEERLSTHIKRLLTENFRVPNARWEECLRRLREGARVRMLGGGSGHWTRTELESVIRAHSGYIASSPELEHYIHPVNWGDVRTALAQRHAVLIVGQSGTGKTLAARKLYDELRLELPGLERISINLGPPQLRDDQTPRPVLYDIEDPWGRYDFDPRGRPWNDQLARSFAHASHESMIVATTRLDVATAAGALENVRRWIVPLEAEHYGDQERSQLYRTRIDALPRELQTVARENETTVLAELATPLEIQKFFDALLTLDRSDLLNPSAYVRSAIDKAHQDSIERTVVDQIEERMDVRAAAVLWGVLKAYERISLETLRKIEELLAEREKDFERGVSPLVGFFVAARNLRQSDATIGYYHPRVESGILRALLRQDLVVRRALRLLADVLVSIDEPDGTWGTAGAMRLVAATDRVPNLRPTLSPNTQTRIDTWVEQELPRGGQGFDAKLRLAAAAGSDASAVSEVARFLLHRPGTDLMDLSNWEPPPRDPNWYARLRAHPGVRPLLEAFIAQVMPTDRDVYGRHFVDEAHRLAPDLSSAFLKAAAQAVHYGVLRSTDAIAVGALADLEGFESIVDQAAEILTPSPDSQEEARRIRLAVINDEYSESYAQYIQDNDEGYTAQEFLTAYVEHVRDIGQWPRVPAHRHLEHLRSYWLRSLGRNPPPPPEEVDAAFAASYGHDSEDYLWYALAKVWNATYRPALVNRIRHGHPERDVRVAALSCLVQCVPGELSRISDSLIAERNRSRLIEIALELVNYRYWYPPGFDEKPSPSVTEPAIAGLPAPYDEVAKAAVALKKKEPIALSADATDLLKRVIARNEEHRLFRVSLDLHIALPIEDDIRWLLANTNDSNAAVEAIDAAVRRGMTTEIHQALSHRFAHVVSRALSSIGQPMAPPLPPELLALSKSKGSPVRGALVALLEAKPHTDHVPVLLELAQDDYSVSLENSAEEYPIAQEAVDALDKSGPLLSETGEQLYKLAIDTRDPTLRYKLFVLVGRRFGSILQQRLLSLSLRPGQSDANWLAAAALLSDHAYLSPEIIANIVPNALLNTNEKVAVRLAITVAIRGEIDAIKAVAQALSTHASRRVLLVPIAAVLARRDPRAAAEAAALLPSGHPAADWAVKGGPGPLEENALDDLGDAPSVSQAMAFIKRWTQARA